MLAPPKSPLETGVIGLGRPATIARWLYAVAALVVLIVIVGGITRLTESGLSITEWKPVSGALPPLTDADWAREFALYQGTTEYQTVNRGMSMADLDDDGLPDLAVGRFHDVCARRAYAMCALMLRHGFFDKAPDDRVGARRIKRAR